MLKKKATKKAIEDDVIKYWKEETSCLADAKIRDTKSDEIIPFLRKAIVKYSLTAKAYSNLRTLTYGIFKYAKEKGYITWSISQTVGNMELPQKAFRKVIKEDEEEVFNDEEVSQLLE